MVYKQRKRRPGECLNTHETASERANIRLLWIQSITNKKISQEFARKFTAQGVIERHVAARAVVGQTARLPVDADVKRSEDRFAFVYRQRMAARAAFQNGSCFSHGDTP